MALRMSQMLRNGKDMRSRTASTGLATRTANAASARAAEAEAAEKADRAAIAPLIEQGAAVPAGVVDIGDTQHVAPASVSSQVHASLVQVALSVLEAAAAQTAPDGPSTVAAVRGVLEDLKKGGELLAVTVRSCVVGDSWAKRSANATVLVDPRGRKLSDLRQMNLGDEPMLYIVDPAIEEGVLEQAGTS